MTSNEHQRHDLLRDELVALFVALQSKNVPLPIVGGGYGLLLRQGYLLHHNQQVMRPPLPPGRATEDLDLFMTPELIVDAAHMETLRDTILARDYVPTAKHFQFTRTLPRGDHNVQVKVDLLAAPPRTETDRERVKISRPRIRPKKAQDIHAYLTREALTIGENALSVTVTASDGQSVTVRVPHPFTYLLLKLHAYRDRRDEEKGPYHAFDLFRIMSMFTREEWQDSADIRKRYAETAEVREAERIARDLFATPASRGVLALRTYAADRSDRYEMSDEQVNHFIEDLEALMGSGASGRPNPLPL
jgi:predicted nucleotidyltransferase